MPSTVTTARRLLAGALLAAVAVLSQQAGVSADNASTAAPPAASPAASPSRAAGSDACGPVRLKGNGTPWTCTFADNFNGTVLDPDRWAVQQTAVTGFRTGRTCYTAAPANVSVSDGGLRLAAVKGRWIRCRNPLGSFSTRYTGGMVGTRGRFSQTYGLFEVRAKYPAARIPGIHGGFWMYPLNHTYGPWPGSGEIDVAEWWSVDPTLVLPSLHYHGREPSLDSGWACRVADATTFHTYAVEWFPKVMRFWIDGQLCWSRSWNPEAPLAAPQPFDHPFNMILGMGVGMPTGVNKVTWQTPFPATYVVDYAKAWR